MVNLYTFEKKLEGYEPSAGDEVDVAEYLLRRAALGRARSERQVVEAVAAARAAGVSWKRIGEQIGTSAQGAFGFNVGYSVAAIVIFFISRVFRKKLRTSKI